MVALLQDFLRAVGLTVGLAGASVLSVSISCLSDSGGLCPASGICVVGDRKSVRGDLCGGAVLGLVEEHLFNDCFTEVTLVYKKDLSKEQSSSDTVAG